MIKVEDAKKLIKTGIFPKTITECPQCGGELYQTYSSEIGFCPNCARQWRLNPEICDEKG